MSTAVHRPGPRQRPRPVAVWSGALMVAAVAAYSAWGSGTRPFTDPADVAVAIPSAIFALGVVLRLRWPETGPWRRLPPDRPASRAGGLGGMAPWLAVVSIFVASELTSYFAGGSRAIHPTVSSGLDSLFHYQAAKAAAFFVWILVGWYFVRR